MLKVRKKWVLAVDSKYNSLIFIILLLLTRAGWAATSAAEDIFYQGDIELYPAPVAVTKVKPAPNIPKNSLSIAYHKFPEAKHGSQNKGVNIRIEAVELLYETAVEQNGKQALKITTLWRNVHAKQKIDRKSLEKKADRTMGAGGFFTGSSKGGSNSNQQIEKDVAYKVPKWGDHLFLLVDGIAYSLDVASAKLKNGVNPSKGFIISRQGQEAEAQFLFRIPDTAENIALQFFDNANGHVQIPLAGNIQLARGTGFPKGLIDQVTTGDLELGVMSKQLRNDIQELRSSDGWKFLAVELVGKSKFIKGGVASFVDIDASKYVWLEGDGGFIFDPIIVLNKSKQRLRFTPEFFSAESVSFLVPDKLQNYQLAVRNGSETSYLNLSEKSPALPPKPFKTFMDGKVAQWQLYSVTRTKTGVLVDIGVQGLDMKKGLEIKPYRQIRLDGSKKKIKPDKRMSQDLAFGAKTLVVVPPKGIARFVLNFKTVEGPLTLHVKGLRTEIDMPINGVPDGDLTMLAMASPVVEKTTADQIQEQIAPPVDSQHEGPKDTTSTDSIAVMKPGTTFTLPDWDIDQAVMEIESGDDRQDATELGKGLVAKGRVGGKSDRFDVYYFDVHGKPQLWAIEAVGASVASVAYLDVSQKEILRRGSHRKTGQARIANLLLMPGRHWIKVTGSRNVDNYMVRVLKLGEIQVNNELEPNDDVNYANRILVGETIKGLMQDGDKDLYRFSLSAQEHLQVVVETSGKMKGRFAISGTVNVREVIAKSAGESVSYQGVFPPGDYMLHVRSMGKLSTFEPYRLKIIRKNPFSEPGKSLTTLPVEIQAVDKDVQVAAYWPQAQRISKSVRLKNQDQTPLALTLQTWSSNAAWHVQPRMNNVSLAPGETRDIPVDILVEPDAVSIAPVSVAVSVKDEQGRMNYQSFELDAVCGADPVKSERFFSPPAPLLGGLNVAWQGLGAEIPAEVLKVHNSVEKIIDGMASVNGGLNMPKLKKSKPIDFTVKLASSLPVPVVGVALNSLSGCASENWTRDFEVDVSSDGKNFVKVLSNSLSRHPVEQYFVFKKPVVATHARLRILTNHGEKARRLCLGEWKVIASSKEKVYPDGLNIALPKHGGHVVWRSFRSADSVAHELLEGAARTSKAYMLSDLPNEWVVGFHHERMARLSRLEWERAKQPSRSGSALKRVRLAISQAGPTGPWEPVGEWRINQKDAVSIFAMKTPVWARYVRFVAEVDKSQYVELPRQIRIIEQETSADYRSIVGEWGHYSSSGPFEWQAPNLDTSNSYEAKNSSKQTASQVKFEKAYHGTASLGNRSAWYRFVIPSGSNTLEWSLSGQPSLSVRPLLMTQDGKMVPIRSHKTSSQTSRYVAEVTAGKTYFMQVEEPPRSVVFTWDDSGSVASFAPRIYQMMTSFAEQIQPGREYVNLLPFQDKDPDMLLEQWSDQPLSVLEYLNGYPRKYHSSNAELNLKKAVEDLEQQDGTRAVLIITDAMSGQAVGRPDLWGAISRVYPRIFSFEMHTGNPLNQDKMQDWASVNSGYYSFFRNQADLDVGFDRAVCMLRRPANFELVAHARYRKPAGPGEISVTTSRGSADTAIEIILDASGSMYKKLDKTTRIAIAKSVLKDLMQTSLPQDVPLALRIYGHRKEKACDTNLEMPLKPFKSKKGISIIDRVDPKNRSRTPLAESLMLVTEDLKSATGRKLVILLTDGEESCGGDPEEAIRFLREQGNDVQLNIVGLAIDSEKTGQQFSHWAKLGGGMYFAANDQLGLKSALEKSLFPKYQLMDKNGDVVVEGVADGSATQVIEGTYQLKILTTPTRDMGEVFIQEGKVVKIEVKG